MEMSAEIKVHFPDKEIILIHSRSDLLSREPLSDEFKAIALQLLKEQGVDVRLNTRLLRETADGTSKILELSTGETLRCDKVVYSAVQQGPNTKFVPASALNEQGYVEVRDTFQFPSSLANADVHYAVGDVARWTGIKRSGPAMSQGKYAATNIIFSLIALEDGKTLSDAELASCPPSKPTMTLAVGDQAIGMRMGLRYGREVKLRAFGTGLGIDGTLANLGLRPRRPQETDKAGAVVEDVRIANGRTALAATASM
jgi:NADH dehydrogenase FAD-containing subunit